MGTDAVPVCYFDKGLKTIEASYTPTPDSCSYSILQGEQGDGVIEIPLLKPGETINEKPAAPIQVGWRKLYSTGTVKDYNLAKKLTQVFAVDPAKAKGVIAAAFGLEELPPEARKLESSEMEIFMGVRLAWLKAETSDLLQKVAPILAALDVYERTLEVPSATTGGRDMATLSEFNGSVETVNKIDARLPEVEDLLKELSHPNQKKQKGPLSGASASTASIE